MSIQLECSATLNILFTDKLKGIFKINFSEKGSNKRSFEEQAYIYFIDFIDECEGTLHVHIYERIAMIRIIIWGVISAKSTFSLWTSKPTL